jgi:hypothetical protein
MDEHIRAMSALTSSGSWPDRWLTIPEFVERLDRLEWWQGQGLAGGTPAGKEAFLRAALEVGASEGTLLWGRLGPGYKHVARLTDEDMRALVAFNRGADREEKAPADPGAPRARHAGVA